jgi:hypothetical protein
MAVDLEYYARVPDRSVDDYALPGASDRDLASVIAYHYDTSDNYDRSLPLEITDELSSDLALAVWQNASSLRLVVLYAQLDRWKTVSKQYTTSGKRKREDYITLDDIIVRQSALSVVHALQEGVPIGQTPDIKLSLELRVIIWKYVFYILSEHYARVMARPGSEIEYYKPLSRFFDDRTGKPKRPRVDNLGRCVNYGGTGKGFGVLAYYKNIKQIFPPNRNNCHSAKNIAWFICRSYLDYETFLPNITHGLPDEVALRIWKEAVSSLAARNDEMRRYVAAFIAKGGLDEEYWGVKGDNDASYTELYSRKFDDKFKHQIFANCKYEHFPAIYRYVYDIEEELGVKYEEPPIGVSHNQPAPLRLQIIRTAAREMSREWYEWNELKKDPTENMMITEQIEVWKDACFHLAKQIMYDRHVIGFLLDTSFVLAAPGEIKGHKA